MSVYYKPQAPIKSGEKYIYPLTTADQVLVEDGSRLNTKYISADLFNEDAGIVPKTNSDQLGGLDANQYATKDYVDNVISSNPSSGEADWEAQKGELGYIKNKPFYEEKITGYVIEPCSPLYVEDFGAFATTEPPLVKPSAGSTYTVSWNGVEYISEAFESDAIGMMATIIGNKAIIGEDDTGEPFVIILAPDDIAAATGFYTQITPLDGCTELELSISGQSAIIHTIDKKFLPPSDVNNSNLVNGRLTGSLRSVTAAEEDLANGYVLGTEALAIGKNAKAEGHNSIALGYGANASSDGSVALGTDSLASGNEAVAILGGQATGLYAFACQPGAIASGSWAVAIGSTCSAEGNDSYAEGYSTHAIGKYSHAEGVSTDAIGECSHAEGNNSHAEGENSHAEGRETYAEGDQSHAEGKETHAEGNNSHAEGYHTYAKGDYSHAEGKGTHAEGDYSHAQGHYNVLGTGDKYAHIVGNGSETRRSNAHTLDWNGLGWYARGLKVGGTSQDDETAKDVIATAPITQEDNGKFLRVVDGVWAAVAVPNAQGVSF